MFCMRFEVFNSIFSLSLRETLIHVFRNEVEKGFDDDLDHKFGYFAALLVERLISFKISE